MSDALNELEKLENQSKGIAGTNEVPKFISDEDQEKSKEQKLVNHKLPTTTNSGKSIIEGWITLERDELPFEGKLYPSNWAFAYRCPTAIEVANFSTIDENDTAAIQNAVSELIRKCFIIINTDTNNEVSREEINDGDRLFFFLKLREFYLSDLPIQYHVINQTYNEPVLVSLLADSLIFPELKEKLLDCFDGRMFTIPVANQTEPIKFRIPTLYTADKLFKNMVKVYKEVNSDDNKSKKTVEKFDKQFYVLAPYLFETGEEKIESLKLKFKKIQANDELFKSYIDLAQKINLTNDKKIEYTYQKSTEEALVRFPGGWRNMFVNSSSFEDLF